MDSGGSGYVSIAEFVKSGNKTDVSTKAIILKYMCFTNILRRLNYLLMVRRTFC
jgi:hypothetical protein